MIFDDFDAERVANDIGRMSARISHDHGPAATMVVALYLIQLGRQMRELERKLDALGPKLSAIELAAKYPRPM